MNLFARLNENPAMTLRVIKETKRYGRTDKRTALTLRVIKKTSPILKTI